MTETVTQFRMGADIPEWCLGVEAVDSSSVKGAARFGCDVDLIETDDYYLICPSNILLPVAGILDFAGAYNCMAVATSKPVRIVQGETVPFPRGMTPMGTNLPPYGICIQPWQPQALAAERWSVAPGQSGKLDRAYARVVADPHESFWARLWHVLRRR